MELIETCLYYKILLNKLISRYKTCSELVKFPKGNKMELIETYLYWKIFV